MKKLLAVSTYILFFLLLAGCIKSDVIGGMEGTIDSGYFKPEALEEFQTRPKTGEKAIFRITHENIDLSGFDIIIQGANDRYYYYYYGPYQKEIIFYLPDVNRNYSTDLVFHIIRRKTQYMYTFSSDLRYFIFKTDKPIQVKLLGEYQKYKGLEINYKLTGCPNDL